MCPWSRLSAATRSVHVHVRACAARKTVKTCLSGDSNDTDPDQIPRVLISLIPTASALRASPLEKSEVEHESRARDTCEGSGIVETVTKSPLDANPQLFVVQVSNMMHLVPRLQ